VTSYEFIEIVGHMESYTNKHFNCHSCLTQYKSRPDYEKNRASFDASLEKQRDIKACRKPDAKPKLKTESLAFYQCPGNFAHPSISVLVDAYWKCERGIMPFAGSYMDQPYKVIEVFNIIDGIIKEKQAKAAEEQSRESKRKR
jgi:hypothetical protein